MTLPPDIVARLDRVQASAEADLDRLIQGYRGLRSSDTASREADMARTVAAVVEKWDGQRTAFALLAAVDRLDRETR